MGFCSFRNIYLKRRWDFRVEQKSKPIQQKYIAKIWMFPKIRVPQMDGLYWKTLSKWIIWGYHYSRKHPYLLKISWCFDSWPQTHPVKLKKPYDIPLLYWLANKDPTNGLLVGGSTNPCEKYKSNWTSSPNRGEHKKYLKPPPSLSQSL